MIKILNRWKGEKPVRNHGNNPCEAVIITHRRNRSGKERPMGEFAPFRVILRAAIYNTIRGMCRIQWVIFISRLVSRFRKYQSRGNPTNPHRSPKCDPASGDWWGGSSASQINKSALEVIESPDSISLNGRGPNSPVGRVAIRPTKFLHASKGSGPANQPRPTWAMASYQK